MIFIPTIKLISVNMNFLDTTYKPLVLYHLIKLKFVKCYFEVKSSNLFPINISGCMVCITNQNIINIPPIKDVKHDPNEAQEFWNSL